MVPAYGTTTFVGGRPFSFADEEGIDLSAMPNYDLMRDIEQRYKKAAGLPSRDFYSIFYGPLQPSKFLMINANPGGSPTSYRIVNVYAGEHEYIEGRNSGPTTRNAAEILQYVAGSEDPEALRGLQVINRFFRRSPERPSRTIERSYVAEARPFVNELINYIEPEAILFGGDSSVTAFAAAHGGTAVGGAPIMGPNGSREAVYFRDYELKLPYYRAIPAVGIYHPCKLNGVFRQTVLPLLLARFGGLLPTDLTIRSE